MNKLSNILKPLSILPALCMMCLIFSFSGHTSKESANLSGGISYKVVSFVNTLTGNTWEKTDVELYAKKWENPIRKLAHVTEYFVLALTVSLPLYTYGIRNKYLFLLTILICVCFAASDEYHQSFVAGRGPSVKDVGIDSIGVLLETFVLWCWLKITHFFNKNRKGKCRKITD